MIKKIKLLDILKMFTFGLAVIFIGWYIISLEGLAIRPYGLILNIIGFIMEGIAFMGYMEYKKQKEMANEKTNPTVNDKTTP